MGCHRGGLCPSACHPEETLCSRHLMGRESLKPAGGLHLGLITLRVQDHLSYRFVQEPCKKTCPNSDSQLSIPRKANSLELCILKKMGLLILKKDQQCSQAFTHREQGLISEPSISPTERCAHLRSVFFNKKVSDIQYLRKNPIYLYNDKPDTIT